MAQALIRASDALTSRRLARSSWRNAGNPQLRDPVKTPTVKRSDLAEAQGMHGTTPGQLKV